MKSIKIAVVLFLFFTLGCAAMTGSEQRISRRTRLARKRSDARGLFPVRQTADSGENSAADSVPSSSASSMSATTRRRRIHHRLGRDAELELRDAFGIEFAKVDVWPVRSEDRAREMLWPEDPENARVRAYDYVAIPKFLRVDSLESNEKYGFEIDLQVEFNAKNGSSITIKGHGETMIGKYAQSTPEKGAVLTLQYAVSALLDGIEKRRNLFVR